MTDKNDSVFPQVKTNGFQGTYSEGGMTKLEYLAAVVLGGILSNYQRWENNSSGAAMVAIDGAKALIKELKRAEEFAIIEKRWEAERVER